MTVKNCVSHTISSEDVFDNIFFENEFQNTYVMVKKLIFGKFEVF